MKRLTRMTVASLLAAGCGTDSRDGSEGDDEGGLSVGMATDGGGVDGGPGGGPSGPSGPKLDVADGMEGDDEGGSGEGCQRVDVIFSVDFSGSMQEEHDALRGPVFDSFPQALLDINNGIDDFQLAVIDACPKPAYYHNWGGSGACNYSTGANYMVSTSPDLAAEYACVTDFVADGYENQPQNCIDDGPLKDDDEQPGLTAAESVSAAAVASLNAGFLRDDALLFIATITDEDEEVLDIGSTQEIFDMIVSAKGGDVNNVVYLGIAGGSDCEGPYGSAQNAVKSQELTALFEAQGRGVFWDLCTGSLEAAFQTTIEGIVDSACADFVPPG